MGSTGEAPQDRDGGVDEATLESRRVIGERLRRLRGLRKLTLEQVASEVQLSPSFLSMLERGQVDIALSRFSRLASFFNIRASELLLEEDSHAAPTILGPEDVGTIDRGPGITYRLLSRDHFGVQVILATFAPKAGFQDVLAHRGHDSIWVTKGELELMYGDEVYRLGPRQFVQFDGAQPHALRNDGDTEAEMVAFTSTPYW